MATSYEALENYVTNTMGWDMNSAINLPSPRFHVISTLAERTRTTKDYLQEFNEVRKEEGILSAISNDFDNTMMREGFGDKFIYYIGLPLCVAAAGHAALSGVESLVMHQPITETIKQFSTFFKPAIYVGTSAAALLSMVKGRR